jgi:hypothetical protein
MMMNNFKKGIVSLALAGSFILGVGAVSSANAQDRRWERQRRIEQQRRSGDYGQVDRNGNIDNNRNGIDDRYETRDGRVDINRNGIADQDEEYGRYGRNRDYYENDGYYENRGYDYNDDEFERGYQDGLSHGRNAALNNRATNPNNSSRYRSGNRTYRAGFERGFYEAYRNYRNRGW